MLGISTEATEREIKDAYRTLSLKNHPDRNKEHDAVSKFQRINAAYEVLSDPAQKAAFDNELKGIPNHPFFGGHDDLSQLFGMMFGGAHGMMPGPGIHIFHGPPPSDIFRQMQKPPPIIRTLSLTLEQAFAGCVLPVEVEKWKMHEGIRLVINESVYVTIPAGVDTNEMIVSRDCGNYISEELVGDVKFVVQIEPHRHFQRVGMDLIHKHAISLKEALTGFAFDLPHLNGKNLCLNNKTKRTVISPQYKKMIPGLGMTREHHSGNLIIEFEVLFPETLTDEQMDQLALLLP